MPSVEESEPDTSTGAGLGLGASSAPASAPAGNLIRALSKGVGDFVAGALSPRGSVETTPTVLQENATLCLSFPYVCPEPVLVKMCIFSSTILSKGSKRGAFSFFLASA